MISKLKILPLIIVIMLYSCAYHDEYPKGWSPISNTAKLQCVDISGHYRNIGESETPNYQPMLSWKLFKSSEFSLDPTHVSFSFIENNKLKVTLWENGQEIFAKAFEKSSKGYFCEEGLIKIDTREYLNRDGVVGTEWHVLGFTKIDDDLIVKDENGAIGMMLLIPVAATGTNWYRFKDEN